MFIQLAWEKNRDKQVLFTCSFIEFNHYGLNKTSRSTEIFVSDVNSIG